MTKWLATLLFVCASAAHAAPPPAAPATNEEIEKLLAEKGLDKGLIPRMNAAMGQLDQVRQNVGTQASDLVTNAMGFLGVPYRRGGNSAETGFDCSGFVKAMYEQTVGLVLPRRAKEQAAATDRVAKEDLQPGDLVFFNTMRRAFSHVGIYVGDGKFIHSPRTGEKVRVEDMRTSYWARRFDGARRVTEAATPPTSETKQQVQQIQ